ncbi:MAG: hypothetical protein IT208_07975 [Chthonomonadales bacterium]|nr:hypothetical protein [Chthonomonadales bacterium]
MSCPACSAPTEGTHPTCRVCGYRSPSAGESEWDRRPEAAAFEDLNALLEKEEALLAATRGRVTGSWRGRVPLDPQTLSAPFANLGLTSRRVVMQYVHPRTGAVSRRKAGAFELTDIHDIRATDVTDGLPARCVRLEVVLGSGESMRVRAAGRLAEEAESLADVWRALARQGGRHAQMGQRCAACGRELDRPYRFCPFCGDKAEEDQDAVDR